MTMRRLALVSASTAVSALAIGSSLTAVASSSDRVDVKMTQSANRVVPDRAIPYRPVPSRKMQEAPQRSQRLERTEPSHSERPKFRRSEGPVLVASLGQRLLTFRLNGSTVLSTRVAVGAPESPTPLGRFKVTEKLSGEPYGGVYGCCILAINARQHRLPAGWTGGNRVAIHGTPELSSIGQAVTAGCLRVDERPLRRLMQSVPVGTTVLVRR
jgi:lipoprotein-anchoring transpeptidase ErfK/SrfK